MLDLKDIEQIQLIVIFVVPGLISLFVRSKFITGRLPSIAENLLTFFVLSLVYYGVTSPLIESALTVEGSWIVRAIAWVTFILVGPAVFGFLLGVAAQKEWLQWIANKAGLSIVHVIPTAWDWRFSKIPRGGMFIMVTLKDGGRIAGFFGPHSFASSDGGERDLYIEEEFEVGDDGIWSARPEKVGILISQAEIKYVEFWQPNW